MSLLFSVVPLIVNQNATFLHHSAVCVINWFTVEAYYLTVTSILIMPCFVATVFNFGRIYFWRLQYRTGFLKLKAANVEYLLEPTHEMSLLLVLVFWCSWLPYVVHLVQYKVHGPRQPTFGDVWTGFAQSVWKFPIMLVFCPRYRNYFCSMLPALGGVTTTVCGGDDIKCMRWSLKRSGSVDPVVDFIGKRMILFSRAEQHQRVPDVELYI